jgi:hypothetical protein
MSNLKGDKMLRLASAIIKTVKARRARALTPELEQFWIATYITHRRIIPDSTRAEAEWAAWQATSKEAACQDAERARIREEARRYKPGRFRIVPGSSRWFAVVDATRQIAILETSDLEQAKQFISRKTNNPEPFNPGKVFVTGDLTSSDMKIIGEQILRRLDWRDAYLLKAIESEGARMRDVAEDFGLTPGRIQQLNLRALQRAKRVLTTPIGGQK